jgi:alkylation response protein AidB-like acyl-CoA dehydrogenase
MPAGLTQLQWSQRKERLLHAARDLVPAMRARTEILDRDACFPSLDFDQLRDLGALSAVIPKRLGGLGLGIDRGGALALFDLLRFLGRGNLAVGRIFEGHVNAFKLISLFGNEVQIERAAQDLKAGHLFAIWNAEAENGVRFRDDLHNVVTGTKVFCSAAGHVTRALITANASAGMRMLLIPLELGERVIPSSIRLHGMRATQTAGIDFDGVNVSADALIGGLDDYLGEPAFSAGAWRTSAVTLGGLDALIDETRRQLVARNRHTDPHQLARMGQVMIARESARLWIERAACVEESDLPAADITGYINLARIALESATLDIIRMVQRTLGLAAFLQSNPVERLMRDLATYLRQPAADEALTEAAAWFIDHEFPEDDH